MPRIAGWSARHPALVTACWALAALLTAIAWSGADPHFTPTASIQEETEARRASDLVAAHFGEASRVSASVVCAADGRLILAADPETTTAPRPAGDAIDLAGCYEAKWTGASGAPAAPREPSPSQPTAGPEPATADSLVRLLLPPDVGSLAAASADVDGMSERIRAIAQDDILRAELVAIPLTVLILLLVIRAPLSPLIPIAVGAAAVVVSIGLIVIAARWATVSIYVVNMIVMLGLAVGIDYTLLVFERFREECRAGEQVAGAIDRSAASAGRSVVISGLSVVIALAGVVFVPISVIRDMALGAILVVVLGMIAVLTLLPALLRIFGGRIATGRREEGSGRSSWARWAATVTRRPVRWGVPVLLVLALLAGQAVRFEGGLSYLSLSVVEPGADREEDYLEQELTVMLFSVVEVAVERPRTPDAERGIDRLVTAIGQDRDFAPVVTLQTSADGEVTVVRVLVVRPSGSPEAAAAVERLRERLVPAAFAAGPSGVHVGGPLTLQQDVLRIIESWQPRIIAFVLAMSVVVLAVAFRSVVAALVATSMTLLSVAAALGVLVLVIQQGVGASLLGVAQVDAIEAWVPLVLFAILFGLSTDYHVFLLGRVQERYRQTGDPTGAVAFGVGATGRIICAAALIMGVVFASFAAGRLVLLQQLGLGLAVAVLIDALLVRLTLVPAIMTVLGHANWRGRAWLPKSPSKLNWRSHASDPTP